MQVNPQQLLDDGYIILREVIPPGQLQELRDCFERIVERQKVIWAKERKPDDPPEAIGKLRHNRACFSMASLTKQPLKQWSFACTKILWALADS